MIHNTRIKSWFPPLSCILIVLSALLFKLIIPFVCISNDIPLPGYPSTAHWSHPPLSPLPSSLWGCSSSVSPTPAPLLQPLSMLGHETSTVPRAAHSIDVRQGQPLLYMYQELHSSLYTPSLYTAATSITPLIARIDQPLTPPLPASIFLIP